MKSVYVPALVLVIIGALNWGLVGLFQFDLVAALFGGSDSAMSRVVYALVGVAGVVVAVTAASAHSTGRLAREHVTHNDRIASRPEVGL